MRLPSTIDLAQLKRTLTAQAGTLGFNAVGVASIAIAEDERHLLRWLDAGYHGEMHYMQRHGLMRAARSSSRRAPCA
jgi:epoxyqueuosine reductase